MGLPAGDAGEVADSNHQLAGEAWERTLPPVVVLRRRPGSSPVVPLTLPEADLEGVVAWDLEPAPGEPEEEGRHPHRGTVRVPELTVQDKVDLEGARYRRLALPLPGGLPEGYWDLRVTTPAGREARTRVVLTPPAAWEPPWMARQERLWGVAAHLCSLRRDGDLGIGDFGHLEPLVRLAAGLGARLVGLNPFHALFLQHPERCSPYAPSDRRFLDARYLDVTAVTGFEVTPEVNRRLESTSLRRTLARLRTADHVDYRVVMRLKLDLLNRLHAAFRERSTAGRIPAEEAEDYTAFRARTGRGLEHFALFETIQQVHRGRLPAPLCDPDGAASSAFAAAHEEELEFHRFLQWQADRQLTAAARTAAGEGLEGFYRDLAVGADPRGSEVWSQPGLFASGVCFGAPPDAFNAAGQDWGMPPWDPRALRERAYAPFIEVVRANLRGAAALRIDHVMALRRLFWVPAGSPAVEGPYVRYPFEDQLGVLALESRRARALIVGEDLGTVPEGFRERLTAEGVLSYRLMMFERWPSGFFLGPDRYPERSVATFTSHDLPTLAGWWKGSDLSERRELGLLGERTLEELETERETGRERLRSALSDQDLPGAGSTGPEDLKEVALGVQRFLARSPARVMMANLDDLLLEERQLNQPGTVKEYPNWRRRLTRPLEDLTDDLYLKTTAAALRREREGPAPPAA